MAVLTSKKRNALPKSEFAGPGRSYPIPDYSHAVNAKARAKQQMNAGRLSREKYEHIIGRANQKIVRNNSNG